MTPTLTTMKHLATALLCAAAASAFGGCTHESLATRDLHDGWVRFGTLGPEAAHGSEPETSPEDVAKYVDSGKRVVLVGTVDQVCRTMGCWLDIRGASGATVRVMNRDHAFFVPRNARGRQVHAIGYATVREQSVELLKHLAADAGRPQSEIDAIVQPERTLLFVADAVLLPAGGLEAPATAPVSAPAGNPEGEAK